MEDKATSGPGKCQVCHIVSKKERKLYNHYGAICCMNCKAFFRRYTRGEIQPPKYQCKGKCNVFQLVRSHCKRCRYQRCLNCGMNPESILDEKERKKYSHPRKKKNTLPALEPIDKSSARQVCLPVQESYLHGESAFDL